MTTNHNYKNYTTFAEFQRVRKENPTLYNSTAFQMAIHSLAEKYGEAFFESRNPNPSSSNTPVTSESDRQDRINRLRDELDRLEEINNSNDGENDHAGN